MPTNAKKKEKPVDCKKFNLGSGTAKNELKKDTSSREIVSSVSAIEVKPSAKNKPQRPPASQKSGNRIQLAVFCGICCFSILICSVFPIPRKLQSFLLKLTEFITEPVLYDTYLISEEHPAGNDWYQKTVTEKLLFPAASDSSIIEAEDGTSKTHTADATYDMSAANMSHISNETAYSVSVEALLSESFPIEKLSTPSYDSGDAVSVFAPESEPTVLIIHTHGTEGYNDLATNNYRTNNTSRNVVAVGRVLAEKLREHGVNVLHCETMFDKNSYIKAYSNSFSAVSEYLSEYPSIKYVIDLHRDAIPASDGKGYARLVSEIDGKSCAQLMLVVGTDEAGAKHPRWRENLRTAFEVQKDMCESYPSLMRSVNLRRASFNQQLCNGYFILEAGNCENSIEEVFESAGLFAQVFAKTIS